MGNKFMGKCLAGMSSAANSVKTSMGNTRQDGKIAGLEKEISALTMEIGNLTLLRLDAGLGGNEPANRPILERYEAIRGAREAIETAEGAKQFKRIVCPHCGAKTSAGLIYCGKCGKRLDEETA